MRVGEMLCEAVRPLFILFLVIAVHANALPLQYLPDIPGYVPVYIRYGNQPLEEINPTLAEAFHESSSIIKNIPKVPLIRIPFQTHNKVLPDKNDISLESREKITAERNIQLPIPSKQLIYVLPKEKNTFTEDSKLSEKQSVIMKVLKASTKEKTYVNNNSKEITEKEGNKSFTFY